ncbi:MULTISPECIES: ALF repeat-containing protein [unclassified Streptomyces]|uniref:ALF repeat-containing protein n=1 Tax=unclassified Streptomyces TaxID=2593676 RepID=UPI00131C01E2|nr:MULTISPECIES: ALF repeat-containing protein [unclassified Streptomyces]
MTVSRREPPLARTVRAGLTAATAVAVVAGTLAGGPAQAQDIPGEGTFVRAPAAVPAVLSASADPGAAEAALAAAAAGARAEVQRIASSGLPAELRASEWNALRSTRGDAAITDWLAPGGGFEQAKQQLRNTRTRNRQFCERVVRTHPSEFAPQTRAAAERALKGSDADRAAFVRTGYAQAQLSDRVARDAAAAERQAVLDRDRAFVRSLAEHDPGEHVRVAAHWAIRPGAADEDVREFYGFGWVTGGTLDLEGHQLRTTDSDQAAALLAAVARMKADAPAPAARQTSLARLSAEADRQLVEDYAEFDEEEEVREAAKKALASTDPNAIREFLERGEAEARQRAKDKRNAADDENRKKIEALRGTGGPYFNAEVERVLKATAQDRAGFLAFGADIARQRDKTTQDNDRKRAEENRKRVEMLVATGGPEVKAAARLALATGDDKVIAEFLDNGYAIAAQKDADERAAREKEQKEALEAAERLRKLAENSARAAEARTKLIAAHGDAVRALKNSSNAMSLAAAASRDADRLLAGDRAGKRVSDYTEVKKDVARQVGFADTAAKQAQVAAGQAKVQAEVLVETGLTHGTQWSDVATGISAAAEAALRAAQTAQHAVDAAAADAAGLNSANQAQLHEQQAKAWRDNAEEHAKAASELARQADKQAKTAADAATKTRQARIDAEQAEKAAWEHARKTRDARVEAQRQAKIAAEQRAIAQRERDLATAARERAERERQTAAQARARAEAEARTASAKRAEAQAAAATAAEMRSRAAAQESNATRNDKQAQDEETKAREARNKAFEAERQHNADEARARATEALAAAVSGTSDAALARQAADAARADANTSARAATAARNASNAASDAAMRSRSAAIEAVGAAARARAAATEASAHASRADAAADRAEAAAFAANAAANKAESEAALTRASAQRANTKAAEATAQEGRAGIAAHEAGRLAALAAVQSNQALQAANRTRDEADGATREAAMAQVQAAVAVQASWAARSTAAGIADPANTALTITAPFSGKDMDADFAAAVASAALQMGKEQVASAEAKAAEAVKAAEAAEAAAQRAHAQVAPAYKAAAAAARSTADATRSWTAAIASASQATEDGAKARAAATRANQADTQAQTDASQARQAANAAYADAAVARDAATQAEAEADRARSAATEAENQATAANSAATLAEKEASTAQAAAAQAEKDAADAAKLATSAEEHAKTAETAAKNANQHAREADDAAKKAEEHQREQQRQERQEAAKTKTGNGSPVSLEEAERKALEAAGITPEAYAAARALAQGDLLDYLLENGAEILVELFLEDIKACIDDPDIPTCLWALVQNIGPAKALKIASKIPRIVKAIAGINAFLDKSAKAKQVIAKAEKVIARVKAVVCPTTPKPKPKSSPKAFRATAAGSGDGFDGWNGWDGWDDCEFIPLGQNLPEKGTEIALDTLALRNLRKFHFEGGSHVTPEKGLFNSDLTLGDLKDIFVGAMSDQGDWKQASGGTSYREKNICLDPKKKFGKSSRNSGEVETHCLTIVVSIHGDLVTMYPILPTT